jgi:ribosome biogenesis GTPase A
MNIQWYPGHMTKAKRMMQEDIKLIDIVIELLDARVPFASRNPDIDSLANNKFRLVLLNKCDLADEAVTARWEAYFKEKGIMVVTINARDGQGMKAITAKVQEACKEKTERDRRRGIMNRPIRAMIAGIPNVGKSTFINSYARKACTKVGNKPGVTKGKQWIRINKNVELLDTPGILWPKFEDELVGEHLAFIGSINDEILQKTELACKLITFLKEQYPGILEKRYQVQEDSEASAILGEIAEKRGCLLKGKELDYEKAAGIILEEFRNGKLGRISVEQPG